MSDTPPSRHLFRSERDRWIAGVCGGIGEFTQVDPLLIRFVFLVLILFGGTGFIIYLLCWLIIPSESQESPVTAEQISHQVRGVAQELGKHSRGSGRPVLGALLIFLGVLFLLGNLGFWFVSEIWKFWPLFLIVAGWYLLTRSRS